MSYSLAEDVNFLSEQEVEDAIINDIALDKPIALKQTLNFKEILIHEKNDGLHNADLFTYQDFVSALKKLELELEIYSKDLYVIKFEIGVNVPLGYPVHQCINIVAFINNKMPIKTTYNMLVTYQ